MSAISAAIGRKADIALLHCTCLLLTQSGHLEGLSFKLLYGFTAQQ